MKKTQVKTTYLLLISLGMSPVILCVALFVVSVAQSSVSVPNQDRALNLTAHIRLDIPALPPEPCYQNSCNDVMSSIYENFLTVGQTPELKSAIYSGFCRHLGMYSPDRDHYATVMLDQSGAAPYSGLSQFRFSTILAFFYERNEFIDWDLEKGRSEMSPYWVNHGKISINEGAMRVLITHDDGAPAMIYWLRQNPMTKELYYIFYSGTAMRSFCQLQLNPNQ